MSKGEELQKQRLLMTESQLREREQQLFQLRADLERRTKEIWDTGGLIERRNAELMQPIYDRLVEAIEQVAQEGGLAFVFEAGDGNLVWADRQYDITEQVLATLGTLMDVAVPFSGNTVTVRIRRMVDHGPPRTRRRRAPARAVILRAEATIDASPGVEGGREPCDLPISLNA